MSQSLVPTAPMDYPPRTEPASQAQRNMMTDAQHRETYTHTHTAHNDAQHTAHTMMHSIERHTHIDIHTYIERRAQYT